MAQIRMDMDESWIWYPVTEFQQGEELAAHLKELEGEDQSLIDFVIQKNTPSLEVPDALMADYRAVSKRFYEIMDVFEALYRQQEGLRTHPGHEKISDMRIKKE